MTEERGRRPMGRGLSALMADVGVGVGDISGERDRVLPIESLQANPEQPRRRFPPEAMEELRASIAAKGVLQPLIVRPVSGRPAPYEIVAGERRWRAAQAAGLHEVPVVVREFDDGEVFEVAIIENIQRDDLSALEEATAFRHLMQRFGHTQEQVAEVLGKSRSHVANLLRLLSLPDGIKNHVNEGRLSAGHARAMLTAPDPGALADRVIADGLSVRQTEDLAKGRVPSPPRGRAVAKDPDTAALEGDLSGALGMRVAIAPGRAGDGGRVTITYRDLDQLDALCSLLSHGLQRD